jgi:tripartite-type tricarboxylate transporter receptor subunit TctC
MKRLAWALRGLTIAGSLAGLPALSSVQAADFYQGKTLTVFVNFTPGGPTDVEARLLARHIGKHLAGNPTVIVKNMGGAGGVIGVNWLGQIAAPDGLTMGFFTGAASKTAMGDPGIQIDLRKFGFVAAGPGISVTYIRTDVPPGIKTAADLMKASNFWVGGLATESDKDVRMRMGLDLLGIKYRYVSGYPGSAEARLAFQRKEVEFFNESMPTYRASIEPALVKTGEAIPVWFDFIDDGDSYTRLPDADGIDALHFRDLYIKMKGEEPKGELWDAYRVVNAVGTTFLRILVVPPGSPKESIAALKQGLQGVQDDADYRDEANKTIKFVPRYVADDKAEHLFQLAASPEPKMRAFIRDYIELGKKMNGKRD